MVVHEVVVPTFNFDSSELEEKVEYPFGTSSDFKI